MASLIWEDADWSLGGRPSQKAGAGLSPLPCSYGLHRVFFQKLMVKAREVAVNAGDCRALRPKNLSDTIDTSDSGGFGFVVQSPR
ncbi:MAG: hypothetical protein JWR19_3797 [Pedosphaera sp.]|nr:hypothetical protein [Pedosphaera sp.]